LDSLAIRLAIQYLEEKDFSYLAKLLHRMKSYVEKGDSDSYRRLNNEFHDFFYQKSQNKWLCDVNTGLMNHIMRLRLLSLSEPDRLKQSYKDHIKIVEAVKRNKNAEAEEIAKKHIKEAGKFVFQLFIEKKKER
jgi:DNA-binding GntR family transcriptional regulator